MRRFLALGALACGLAVFGASDDAEACGGCFVPPEESTVVTGHRMALSISQDRTVLWDQIQYTGDPEDFSWVLPVKPGAVLEIGNDAWFEVLEAATRMTVTGEQVSCGGSFGGDGWEGGGHGSGFGCGNEMYAADSGAFNGSTGSGGLEQEEKQDVDVVSEGSAGPYDMVTLSTDVPGALDEWLEENGYQVPDEIQPIIDAYVADGFDFIALRLSPGAAVSQMKPVRVITPGSSFALPLKMVAAGTGATTALTLFMLAEGRYEAQNFVNARLEKKDVIWDYATSSSNANELRVDALAENDGRTWLTSYARRGSLLSPYADELSGSGTVTYNVGGQSATTIAQAYVRQGLANGEGDTDACLSALDEIQSSDAVVVEDMCDGDPDCMRQGEGDIPSSSLACGDLDDVATALVGMHPRDVWVARLEAELPRTALDADLLLGAAVAQTTVPNRFVAGGAVNSPCASASPLTFDKPGEPRIPGGPVTIVLGALAMGLLARRRQREVAVSA